MTNFQDYSPVPFLFTPATWPIELSFNREWLKLSHGKINAPPENTICHHPYSPVAFKWAHMTCFGCGNAAFYSDMDNIHTSLSVGVTLTLALLFYSTGLSLTQLTTYHQCWNNGNHYIHNSSYGAIHVLRDIVTLTITTWICHRLSWSGSD